MALLSGSSSTPSSHHWKYDVFLSFRGKDTRTNFTDHLKSALLRAGIRTFFDENDLETGDPIGPDLLKAIEESMCWIIVFSKDYASSTWCLDELAHIMECKKTSNRKLVPIFYDVKPSDVRKQEKSFEEAFGKHQVRFKHESGKLKRWRDALTEATNLTGVDARNRPESLIVEDIVTEILNQVKGKKLSLPVNPVGLDYRAQEVISLLEKVDVCIVGIYGIGGIGKTTIAREVYNTIYQKFNGSCFLTNIREASDDFHRVRLQKQLLSQVLKRRDEDIDNVYQGVQAIEKILHHLSVLVILDDVDDPEQLYKIIGNHQQFCRGSKIIITTRCKDLLKPLEGYRQYWVPKLNTFESLELLSRKAFGRSQPPQEYMECSNKVIDYCKGIPLALEVLGSMLSRKTSVRAWISKLKELEEIVDVKIQSVLEISYRSLSVREQYVFLDIACFFIGTDQDYVISILDGCNFYPTNAIDTLIHMCLLKINFWNKYLEMHDLIRDMGRDIVRRECDKDPGMRSRVWRKEEALDLLRDEMGTKTVEGLSLNLQPGSNELFNTTAFMEMKNLRLLQLDYIELEGAYKYILKRLRWLRWHGFPLESIPADLHLRDVVVLDMRYSSLRQFREPMKMGKLKILDLSHSRQLTQTPNFEGLPSLEIMKLKGCISLVEVDESIGFAVKLVTLNLEGCINLERLPKSFLEVGSLDKLNTSGCTKLFSHSSLSRPISDGQLVPVSIKELDISYCNLMDDMIPNDIQRLQYLKVLDISGNNFSRLPAGISYLPQLKSFFFFKCRRLESVMVPPNLTHFDAMNCTRLSRINMINPIWGYYRGICEIQECPVLLEVDGVFKVEPIDDETVKKLETLGLPIQRHMSSVRLFMTNYITDTTTAIRFLPAVSEQGVYIIYIPGNEIPNCYSHQNEGNSVSFTVPHKSDIAGFIFCAVYAWDESFGVLNWCDVLFKNESKHVEYEYTPNIFCYPEEYDITLHGFWRFGVINGWHETEGGDQVEVEFIERRGLQIKKCGVGLLYERNNTEDSQINTSLFLQL